MNDTCAKCKKSCDVGYNAVFAGRLIVCDKCAGIERDKNGYVWHKDETEQTYLPVDGSPAYTVTRAEAFRKD